MKLVEVEGIAPTRSILQGLAVPMTVTPNAAGRSCTRIFGVRSVALSSVELRQRKVEPRPGNAPGKCRFADDRVRLLAREAMVRRPGNAPGGG